MFHFNDGQPHLQNQLIDQAQTASALIHASECTGEKKFLTKAETLLKFSLSKLQDPESGGFFDTGVEADAPGFLKKPVKPLDENSIAARALVKLHHLTGDSKYLEAAERALKCFVDSYLNYGFMAAEYALAVDTVVNHPTMIRIVGSRDSAQTKALLSEAVRIYEPRKIIQLLDPVADAKEISEGGYSVLGTATAYICVGTACTAPITEPRKISSSVQRMLSIR